MVYKIRLAEPEDSASIHKLYKGVSQQVGGIARVEDEITEQYVVHNLHQALQSGVCLVVEHPQNSADLIGEIHCYKLTPNVFNHVLSELTVVVHPDFQSKGIGKRLFERLLTQIKTHRNDILRVELIARESNQKAIAFYQKIGFLVEGRLSQRIDSRNGEFEADIPMAWFNQHFKQPK